VWVEGDDVSPSGGLFLSKCTAAGGSLCARATSGGGRSITIPFASTRLIGWWDDRHVAGWRISGDGYEAVVVDLKGRTDRVLATAGKKTEFDDMGFRYSRGTP
jgi:hypothetical protein